jgi:O-antigen/teichoic acid export membrane protein
VTVTDSARPTLFRNAFFASVSAASAVLLLALLLVAGRFLGESDFGRFSFALALATIFETFVDFGLSVLATRSIARDRTVANRLVANTAAFKLVLGAVMMLGLGITARLLRPEADVRLACYLLGLSSVLRSFLLTARHVLMGLERFGLDSLLVVGDRLLLFVIGVGALVLGYGLIGLSTAFVVARVLALILAYVLSRSQVGSFRLEFDLAYWRDLQTRAFPLGAFALVLYVYNYVDTVMLGVMRTDAETGLYNAAYRVYEGLSSLPAILYSAVTPRLSLYFVGEPERHRRLARRGALAALLLAVPVTLLSLVGATPIMELLYGPAYQSSAVVLQILAAGFVGVFPLLLLHAVAISANAEHLSLRTAAIGCVANVVLNLVLIPLYGMRGAAAATVIGEIVSLVTLFLGLRRLGL